MPSSAPFKVVVCGSVDHGKSTLLGRLLLDCGAVPEDRARRVEKTCAGKGIAFEPAFLLDALREEQEQGITIDTTRVAFEREGRRFLLIDAPGHQEFLKNMATGASEAETGLLIVDALEGVKPQTVRHLKMLALLGASELVVAVNKMDAAGYDPARFKGLAAELERAARAEALSCRAVIPVAALRGENLLSPSPFMPWHEGGALLPALAAAASRHEADSARALAEPFRMVLQDVYRFGGERRYAGRVVSGRLERGEQVLFSPSGKLATVAGIARHPRRDLAFAEKGDSVALTLSEQVFVERGEVLSRPAELPRIETRVGAKLAWFGAEPLDPAARYLLKIGAAETRCAVELLSPSPLPANGAFFDAVLHCDKPVAFDDTLGRDALNKLVLCDARGTAAAGVVSAALAARKKARVPGADVVFESGYVGRREREKEHSGAVLWLTGLSGAGKSSLAKALERDLHGKGLRVVALDGDNLRKGLCADLGFSPEDRAENIRRIAHAARLFLDAGFIVITACISPYSDDREAARQIIGPDDFHEIFVYCPLEICRERDPKGLYKKAAAGGIAGFSGTSAPYQPPARPALRLDTSRMSVAQEARAVEALLDGMAAARGRIG